MKVSINKRKGQTLLDKVRRTLKRHNFLTKGDKVIVALSGGPDSVCLLHILKELAPAYNLSLHIAHVNYQLRGEESLVDEVFVKGVAESFGIPLTIKRVEIAGKGRGNLQEVAREVRYNFLQGLAEEIGFDKIALGHTADDQAETFLIRILRGSGTSGLSGIPLVREGRFIRPLLSVSRKEILDYLKQKAIPFREDSTNIKPLYLRNKIRHTLLPLLAREYNKNIAETLSREADILRADEEFLKCYVEGLLPGVIVKKKEREIGLSIPALERLHLALKRRTIRRCLEIIKGDLRGISFSHIDEVIEDILIGETGRRIDLPKGIVFEKNYDTLSILIKKEKETIYPIPVKIPGETLAEVFGVRLKAEIVDGPISVRDKRDSISLDLDKIPGDLFLRKRERGDYFYPKGMGGKKKKLKEFFIDIKVSRRERDMSPILATSEGIVWVIGHRADERYKVTDETKRVLLLSYTVSENNLM